MDKFIASFDFYPRPPRGGRPTSVGCVTFWFLFLSTPSARRATLEWHLAYYSSLISIHALREEGDSIRPHGQRVDAISIHALREEGDLEGVARDVRANISIHALREEGDRRPPFC